jgi:adenylate cyclase
MPEAKSTSTRKLAAILLADVVSYSRMMGEDEEGTLARLKTLLAELIEPTILAFNGRIVKLLGDGILAEFPSSVEATACAVTIQESMPRRNADIPENRQIRLRMGIHIGDIIVDGDDIYGDGVNICARLEPLAPIGGICISEAVHDSIRNKLELDVESLGEQQVKNIANPVRVFSVKLKPGAELPQPRRPAESDRATSTANSKGNPRGKSSWILVLVGLLAIGLVIAGLLYTHTPAPEIQPSVAGKAVTTEEQKPSIAVLPFTNMSNDPEQEYFSDGISEDIITSLSKLGELDVIARNSSFTFKGSDTTASDAGKGLGVKYILEGSVRKANDRVRITAQLVDTLTGRHLWGEKFDRQLTDVFAVQDEITSRIVSALSLKLTGDEQLKLSTDGTDNFQAYDLLLQGQPYSNTLTREGIDTAIELYRKAIRLDPGFSRAYSALSVTLSRKAFSGMSTNPQETKAQALELARKAVELGPSSPQALWALGFAHMHLREYDKAIEMLEKAVDISPSYSDGYGLLALIKNNTGHPEEAIRLTRKGMELNPYYSWEYLYNLGRAYYSLGDYDKAIDYLAKAVQRNETVKVSRLHLIAALVRAGRQEDAEWQVTELKMQSPNKLRDYMNMSPISDKKARDQLFGDLRAAGLE